MEILLALINDNCYNGKRAPTNKITKDKYPVDDRFVAIVFAKSFHSSQSAHVGPTIDAKYNIFRE